MVKWLKEAALRRTDCHGTNPALHKVDSLKEGINLIARAKGITDDKKRTSYPSPFLVFVD